jgi:hypothetical protein
MKHIKLTLSSLTLIALLMTGLSNCKDDGPKSNEPVDVDPLDCKITKDDAYTYIYNAGNQLTAVLNIHQDTVAWYNYNAQGQPENCRMRNNAKQVIKVEYGKYSGGIPQEIKYYKAGSNDVDKTTTIVVTGSQVTKVDDGFTQFDFEYDSDGTIMKIKESIENGGYNNRTTSVRLTDGKINSYTLFDNLWTELLRRADYLKLGKENITKYDDLHLDRGGKQLPTSKLKLDFFYTYRDNGIISKNTTPGQPVTDYAYTCD